MKQKFLIVVMACITVLSGCTDQPVAIGDALEKICVERKVIKQALEKSEPLSFSVYKTVRNVLPLVQMMRRIS